MRQYIWKCFKMVKCCAGSFPTPHPHTNCCGSSLWHKERIPQETAFLGGGGVEVIVFLMLFGTISTCKNSNVGRDHFFPQSSLPAAKIICYVNGNISTVVCGTWWWLQINSLTICQITNCRKPSGIYLLPGWRRFVKSLFTSRSRGRARAYTCRNRKGCKVCLKESSSIHILNAECWRIASASEMWITWEIDNWAALSSHLWKLLVWTITKTSLFKKYNNNSVNRLFRNFVRPVRGDHWSLIQMRVGWI